MQSGKFLQSKEWEEFQKSLNRKTFYIEGNLIIKMPFFKISYLYCPKGPDKITEKFLTEVKKIGKHEHAIFFRCEPPKKPSTEFIKVSEVQPTCTQILDLKPTEEELLSKMKQKTRYNIKISKKNNIQIEKCRKFDDFYLLLQETAERQNIKIYSKNQYQKLAKFNEIFIAYYKNKPAAGAMINFYKDTATYLHGGSSSKYKKFMAPYLLHLEIIKEAKSRGFKFYDWWGIGEKWPGITRFKQGFGGKAVCAPGTYDLPLNKLLYKIYTLKKIGK